MKTETGDGKSLISQVTEEVPCPSFFNFFHSETYWGETFNKEFSFGIKQLSQVIISAILWYIRVKDDYQDEEEEYDDNDNDDDDDDDDDEQHNEVEREADSLRQQLTTRDREIEALREQLEAQKKELEALRGQQHQPQTGK